MRSRILGASGLVWGGATIDLSSAYAAGRSAGLLFGAALFLVGGYHVLRRSSA